MNLKQVKPASKIMMNELGYTWDNCFSELVPMTNNEVEDCFNATESLYSMYTYTVDFAIRNNMWDKFGITNSKLIEVIKKEWNDNKFRHVWGRFDFAGGTSGLPLKLLEFNADTATAIVETSVLQYAVAVENNLVDVQFNDVYESIINSFKQFKKDWDSPIEISMAAFSFNSEEDHRTIQFLSECAAVAGIEVDIVDMTTLYFDKEQGIFISEDGKTVFKNYNVLLKLVPWETIINEESEYADIIFDLILNDELVVINPVYTLMFQNKYILKMLSDLYPDNNLILKCSETPLKNIKYVTKPIFGREGSDVSIINANGSLEYAESGLYSTQKMIYQEYAELDRDLEGKYYQIGSFMCNESCGIAFRRSNTPIIVNTSEFVGHYVEQ